MNNVISVIIPFKNEEKYIAECCESILLQEGNFTFEILFVDDHSTDKSPVFIKEYAANNTNIYYHLNPGNGVVDALNFGLSIANGDYISRMDADDIMPAKKLNSLLDVLVFNPKVHIATGYVSYFRNDQKLGAGFIKYQNWLNALVDTDSYYTEIFKECPVASANWMISKENLLNVGGFGKKYPEDYDLIFRFLKSKYRIKGVKQITHFWRDHSERASRNLQHYADSSFIDIKIYWFLKLQKNSYGVINLLGAGTKGKKAAKLLIENCDKFNWFTNNINKIGHNIYDVILKNEAEYWGKPEGITIVLVSNPIELESISAQFQERQLIQGVDYFLFS